MERAARHSMETTQHSLHHMLFRSSTKTSYRTITLLPRIVHCCDKSCTENNRKRKTRSASENKLILARTSIHEYSIYSTRVASQLAITSTSRSKASFDFFFKIELKNSTHTHCIAQLQNATYRAGTVVPAIFKIEETPDPIGWLLLPSSSSSYIPPIIMLH